MTDQTAIENEITTTQCALCGSAQSQPFLIVGEWVLRQCSECKFVFLSPRPTPEVIAQLYSREYLNSHLGGSVTAEEAERLVAGQSSRVRFVQKHASAGHGRLLDVGCAAGYFCECARRAGFKAQGCDISEWARDEAARLFNIPVTVGDFARLSFADAPFDVVTMWHALEHVPDLGDTMSKVREVLAPGGLLVLEIPNCGSYDARKFGDAWRGWALPYHNWHFTPASITQLMENHGFRVRSIWRPPSQYVMDRMRALPILKILRRPVAMLFSGRDMRVAAVKTEAMLKG